MIELLIAIATLMLAVSTLAIALSLRAIVETLKTTNVQLELLRTMRVEHHNYHNADGGSWLTTRSITDALSQNAARERALAMSKELNKWEIQGEPRAEATSESTTAESGL